MSTVKLLISSILVLVFSIGYAVDLDKEGVPIKPKKERLVNDLTSAGFFSKSSKNRLESELVDFSEQTGTQIALVVLDNFNGYDKALLATAIGHKWGVGEAGKDNGIVILLKPKTSNSRGEVHIATGYGLEGVIPDATAKQIVEYEMIPEFKKGEYNKGISKAVTTLKSLALKEFSPQDYIKKKKKRGKNGLWGILPFLIFFFFFSLLRRRGRTYGSSSGFWTGMFIGSALGGHHRSSGWSNFSSGSGGFGGFGGGGFGGGGAGGSW